MRTAIFCFMDAGHTVFYILRIDVFRTIRYNNFDIVYIWIWFKGGVSYGM